MSGQEAIMMIQQDVVSSIGNGEYRIVFAQPIEFDGQIDFFIIASAHSVKLLLPGGTGEIAIGVEGKKESLLSWLRSLDVDEASLKSYADAMTE
jgi:hypothetical protein